MTSARPQKNGGTLTQAAYKKIKTEILNGTLSPGRVVSVSSLVHSHGMGVGPIREALHRLCGEDLVEALPQHGYRIKPLTMRDVVQLYEVLGIMLPNTGRLAALNPRIREHCQQMLKLNAVCNAALPPNNEDEERAIIEAGRAVSRIIAESTDNPILLRILTSLFLQIDRVLHIWRKRAEHPIDFRRDYSAVIAALQQGDQDAAAKATQAMVEASKAHIVEGILNQIEFHEVSLY